MDRAYLRAVVAAALREDVGVRDLTTQSLIPKGAFAKGEILFREEGVVAGLPAVELVFGIIEPKVRFKPMVKDGAVVHPNKAVAFIEGPARGILTAERTALNFLGMLSGIATMTRRCVEAARRQAKKGATPPKILDTRKTAPNLRLLEKYAVAVGGGTPHRMGLYAQVLIKDNHLAILSALNRERLPDVEAPPPAGSVIEQAVQAARSENPRKTPVEVEVENLDQFRQALSARAEVILLDNMPMSQVEEAVRIRDAVARSRKGLRAELEVSGGIVPEQVGALAAAGVDRISMGMLTHSAPWLNVALEIVS
ncbi:MAG: nicotinate-nucleotide diphosphorylase (carboxylating) [Candidatus Omnitrophica bacterium CG11_big_fil_rev_8_21_14_0_20_64_10]|nr:MAG: nicotinate-nucleotide diphosphorylase (carboxylating) [Candidatus Omnitrophica bacterium CG11_big_fil_rev_8_21_14_0_20_64_10]